MPDQSEKKERVKLNLQLGTDQVQELLNEGRRMRIEVERRIRSMQLVSDEQLRARVR